MRKKLVKDIITALDRYVPFEGKASYFYDPAKEEIRSCDLGEDEDMIETIVQENKWVYLDTLEVFNLYSLIEVVW